MLARSIKGDTRQVWILSPWFGIRKKIIQISMLYGNYKKKKDSYLFSQHFYWKYWHFDSIKHRRIVIKLFFYEEISRRSRLFLFYYLQIYSYHFRNLIGNQGLRKRWVIALFLTKYWYNLLKYRYFLRLIHWREFSNIVRIRLIRRCGMMLPVKS